ncbi:hypothetical protein AAZX31_09G159500 [Glycine max]
MLALFYTAARAFKFHSLSLGFISIYIFESGTTLLLRNRIIDAPFHDELWFAVANQPCLLHVRIDAMYTKPSNQSNFICRHQIKKVMPEPRRKNSKHKLFFKW